MDKSPDKAPLKSRTAWNHIEAIDRATKIVNSWPEWKRDVTLFKAASDSDVEGSEIGGAELAAGEKRAA